MHNGFNSSLCYSEAEGQAIRHLTITSSIITRLTVCVNSKLLYIVSFPAKFQATRPFDKAHSISRYLTSINTYLVFAAPSLKTTKSTIKNNKTPNPNKQNSTSQWPNVHPPQQYVPTSVYPPHPHASAPTHTTTTLLLTPK